MMNVRPRNYVDRLPGGLLRSLFAGRWLPVIGAGFSRNAVTDDGRRPPDWSELGNQLAADVPSADATNPVDAISAYADTYGRPALVERLSKLLLLDEIEPSDTHLALAQLPFDMVVTTNADFLLEEAYQRQHRPYVPILGESQLTLARRVEATYLLKFHGDLRHPNELIMTEEDYDGFLRRRPLLATCISWWLLTREPVLFGYSLDDADLRDVLALLRERLGPMTRAGWAVLPTDADGRISAKFARRGIKPIVLEEDISEDRGKVLEQFFHQLRTLWEQQALPRISARTDALTAELRRA